MHAAVQEEVPIHLAQLDSVDLERDKSAPAVHGQPAAVQADGQASCPGLGARRRRVLHTMSSGRRTGDGAMRA